MRSYVALLPMLALSSMLVHVSRAQQISQSDFAQYQDQEYRFSIRYPRSWARTEATHAQTRFKVVSDGGAGADDLSVVVTTVPGSKNITPEEFLKSMNAEAYLAYVQQNVPGAKLIEHGPTTLSNQAAYYFVTDLTHRVLGLEAPMRQIQVQTVRNRNVYTITFRTDPGHLPESLKEFVLITAGFVLWPDPPGDGVVGRAVQAPYRNAPATALGPGVFALLLIGLFMVGAAILRFAFIGRALSKPAALGVVAPVWLALIWLHHQGGQSGTPPWISAGAVAAWFLLTSANKSENRTSAQSDDSDGSGRSSPDAH